MQIFKDLQGNQRREAKRRLAVKMVIEQDATAQEAADLVEVHATTVRAWLRAYREYGESSLVPGASKGRPPKLSDDDLLWLCQALLQDATEHGFPTNLWTCSRVAALIQQEFGVCYHPDHISKLLRQLGFSHQKPEGRARECDEGAIKHWVNKGWPRIKKSQASECDACVPGRIGLQPQAQRLPDLVPLRRDAGPSADSAGLDQTKSDRGVEPVPQATQGPVVLAMARRQRDQAGRVHRFHPSSVA